MSRITEAMLTAKNVRLSSNNGDHVTHIGPRQADLARLGYIHEGHYCTPVTQEGDGWSFDVYDLGVLPSDDFPMIGSPVDQWAAYARSHRARPGITADSYPAIDGDELAKDAGGSLARTSVVGETTLWEKVSA